MDQVLKDQSLLAQQIAATGKAVAHLSMEREVEADLETYSRDSRDARPPFHRRQPRPFPQPQDEPTVPTHISVFQQEFPEGSNQYRGAMPKLFSLIFVVEIQRFGVIGVRTSSCFITFQSIFG